MPRKSGSLAATAAVTANDDEPKTATSTRPPRESIGIEDLTLPRAMVQRLARGVLPPSTAISKDSLLALNKSATVFINFLAASASENAYASGKKTIAVTHVLAALRDTEFDAFIPRVEAELSKYNDIQAERLSNKQKAKEAGGSTDGAANGAHEAAGTGSGSKSAAATDDDGERPTKKARRDSEGHANGEQDSDADGADHDGEDDVDGDVDGAMEAENGDEADEAESEEGQSDDGSDSDGDDGPDRDDPDRINDGMEDEALDDHGDSD